MNEILIVANAETSATAFALLSPVSAITAKATPNATMLPCVSQKECESKLCKTLRL
jgi:hypothetical protein